MPRSRAIFETCFALAGAALYGDSNRRASPSCPHSRIGSTRQWPIGGARTPAWWSARRYVRGMVCWKLCALLCRFDLTFHTASDEGVFPPEVLAARQQREVESLKGWQQTAAGLQDLAALHAWLHSEHMCYAVARQVRGSLPCVFLSCDLLIS